MFLQFGADFSSSSVLVQILLFTFRQSCHLRELEAQAKINFLFGINNESTWQSCTKIIIRNMPAPPTSEGRNQKLPPHSPVTWWLLSDWKSPSDFHINTYPTLAHLHTNNWHSGRVGMIAIKLQQWSLPIMDSRYIFNLWCNLWCTTKIHWNIDWHHETKTWSDKTWPQPALVELTRALEFSD